MAVDHPNIVTVFSVEEATTDDGVRRHFITMQLVEGKTLSELIPRNGLSVEKFFDLAIPLADAISAAHDQGIVHRDLKPANIMVSDDGRVRVLDFGLAKLREEEAGPEARSALPTAAATKPEELTDEGMILGTVAYMSPEQAEGKPVDHRTDVFSLGILLYEMATGERPFKGDTKVSVMSSILRESPTSVTKLNRNAPRHLARIVKHGLEKDVSRRFQSARDLKNELEELAAEVESGEVVPAGVAVGSTRPRVGIGTLVGVAAIVVIAVAAFAIWTSQTGHVENAADWRMTRLTRLPGIETSPSIHPDGDEFLYTSNAEGNWDIYLQKVDGSSPNNLTANRPERDRSPAFSPDGQRIAFSSGGWPGSIYVMGPTGENPRRVAAEGYQPAWSPDGNQIVYADRPITDARAGWATRQLSIVDLESRETRELASGYHPSWSPSGERIAYLDIVDGVRDIWTIAADGTEQLRVTDDMFLDWNPVWAPDGRYLYFASNRGGADNIWQVSIDEATGVPRGERIAVFSDREHGYEIWTMDEDGNGARRLTEVPSESGVWEPFWAPDGERLVVYVPTSESGPPWGTYVVDITAAPAERALQALPRLEDGGVRPRSWSPDGRYIAGNGDGGIMVYSFESDSWRRVDGLDGYGRPHWMNDSRRLLLRRENAIFVADSQTGIAKEVYSLAPDQLGGMVSLALSPDERTLYLVRRQRGADIHMLAREPAGQ